MKQSFQKVKKKKISNAIYVFRLVRKFDGIVYALLKDIFEKTIK
jgi:hypothetical protein